jgi:hypothetical protein
MRHVYLYTPRVIRLAKQHAIDLLYNAVTASAWLAITYGFVVAVLG